MRTWIFLLGIILIVAGILAYMYTVTDGGYLFGSGKEKILPVFFADDFSFRDSFYVNRACDEWGRKENRGLTIRFL